MGSKDQTPGSKNLFREINHYLREDRRRKEGNQSSPKGHEEGRTFSMEERLKLAVLDYRDGILTPDKVNTFWQTFLETSIKTQGLDIPVSTIECDRTLEELEALKKDGRIWIPETQLTYPQLGKIFPKMGSYTVEENSPTKDEFEQDAKGVDVETSIASPNINTKEKELRELFESQGRKVMRLSTYILASQASKVLTGRYLDEDSTWSRLLLFAFPGDGGGHVAGAKFTLNGRLGVYSNLNPQSKNSRLGGRSEGIKRSLTTSF